MITELFEIPLNLDSSPTTIFEILFRKSMHINLFSAMQIDGIFRFKFSQIYERLFWEGVDLCKFLPLYDLFMQDQELNFKLTDT